MSIKFERSSNIEWLHKYSKKMSSEERILFNNLINNILKKNEDMTKLLIEINSKNLIENNKFKKYFDSIHSDKPLEILEKHFQSIINISNDANFLIHVVNLINEGFPCKSDLKSFNINLGPYREYSFPNNYLELIQKSFISEIGAFKIANRIYEDNELAFEQFLKNTPPNRRQLAYRINKPKFNLDNQIFELYTKFIEQKIFNIISSGTDYSGAKSVNASTNYRFGRRGNK